MIRGLLTAILFFSILAAFAQKKYATKNGYAWFRSETSLETIEAHNRQVTALLSEDGKIAFRIMMKSFQFEKALMQEHFNENYVESDKYPKATFEGNITNLKDINFNKNGVYTAQLEGEIALHGVTKKVKETAVIEVKDGVLLGKSQLTILLSDYDIKVPAAVTANIAKSIVVNIEVKLEEIKK
jgi:polyisoprenoid-binding protein YceI